MSHPIQRCEIAVVGGSFTGMVMALSLAKQGFDVRLIEQSKLEAQLTPEFDGRGHAIAASSQELLQTLGIWSALQPLACSIDKIEVWDHTAPNRPLRFGATDAGTSRQTDVDDRDVDDTYVNGTHVGNSYVGNRAPLAAKGSLGHIAENLPTRAVLVAEVRRVMGQCLWDQTGLAHAELTSVLPQLTFNDGRSLKADLVIACDGRGSVLRSAADIGVQTWDYQQAALVTCLHHTLAHDQIARQAFLPNGPFAALPLPTLANGQHRSSLVWSQKQGVAQGLAV